MSGRLTRFAGTHVYSVSTGNDAGAMEDRHEGNRTAARNDDAALVSRAGRDVGADRGSADQRRMDRRRALVTVGRLRSHRRHLARRLSRRTAGATSSARRDTNTRCASATCTGERILAVTSVDGVNAVSGETASPEQSGYVIDAWGSVEITGWRKSLDRTAAFYFTDLGDSYAARTGRPEQRRRDRRRRVPREARTDRLPAATRQDRGRRTE